MDFEATRNFSDFPPEKRPLLRALLFTYRTERIDLYVSRKNSPRRRRGCAFFEYGSVTFFFIRVGKKNFRTFLKKEGIEETSRKDRERSPEAREWKKRGREPCGGSKGAKRRDSGAPRFRTTPT
ncbi:hypothetical protein TNCT_214601 [Trichonephila clavata]|uniref:Uncharacterized protein n=1 Tax=Trichonephila clavata TaxID=2740835 RepID=A0A8X6FAU9_TRICU|nr:hypothetical protein TNCT_214601 [Trichonephila clavata]